TDIRSARELTEVLRATPRIASVHYFGHSAATQMFLKYSVSRPAEAEVVWGADEAKQVPRSQFLSDAVFASYGCSQGDPGGLADQIRKIWKIRTFGSRGR